MYEHGAWDAAVAFLSRTSCRADAKLASYVDVALTVRPLVLAHPGDGVRIPFPFAATEGTRHVA